MKDIKKEIVRVFSDMIADYEEHGCITKTCYCLNNTHMEYLLKLKKEIHNDKSNQYIYHLPGCLYCNVYLDY